MNDSILFKAPSAVSKKMNRLYQLLIHEKSLFEQVAGHVTDNSLRCTILSLAQQSNQYAAELSCCMQSTGEAGKLIEKSYPGTHKFPDENKVLAWCSSNERKIVIAYRKILEDSALYEGIKKMMRYQLNGILSASVQLKLLSSLKKRHHSTI